MLIDSPDRPERFNSLFLQMVRTDVARELLGLSPSPMDQADISYLLSAATRFALSDSSQSLKAAEDCRLAYEVAIRAPNLAGERAPRLQTISDLILTRLGNFPARHLLRSRNSLEPLDEPVFQIENVLREEENSVASDDTSLLLTNFQARLLDGLEAKSFLSISAPTSAGKSFTLELELLRRFKSAIRFNAIYLVPTRALIRQVSLEITDLVRRNNVSAQVLSSPVVPPGALLASSKCVFVLTQERFATLLTESPVEFVVDAIITDEAQEISKDSRGITLERVLRSALLRHPEVRLFFSSPLRSNPEFLLELFGKSDDQSLHFVERDSPVTQNLISIHPVKGSPRLADISVTVENKILPIGRAEFSFALRDSYMGLLAVHFTKGDDTSIVYCNRPSDATRVARKIAGVQGKTADTELLQFATFLRQEVHRLYYLPALVEAGVAFHYANLPQIVRGKIEDLIKDRKIKYVCCTSTLLQGMNLPARNLFLENPQTGQGEPGKISRGDFWNLAGRAGRLAKEFTGNVFCVFGKSWDETLLRADRLVPLESAQRVATTVKSAELAFYSETLSTGADRNQAWAEYTLAGLYASQLRGQAIIDPTASEPTQDDLRRISEVCIKLRATQSLPDTLYTDNFYVHPQRMEDLAIYFRQHPNLRDLMPLAPQADSQSARLTEIFRVIDSVILRMTESRRHLYFGYLGTRWMSGTPLRTLILDHLSYNSIPTDNQEKINSEINRLFEAIEKDLRYTYVKYSSIYTQVLREILRERSEIRLSEGVLPINLFLEFGASTVTVISLMSLGLSRTTALQLKSEAGFPNDLDSDRCQLYLSSINLERTALSEVCKAEVRRLRGKS